MTQLPGRAHTAHRQLARSALFSTSPTATTVCGLADLVGGHRLEARERRVEGEDLAETQFGAAESAHAGVAVLERERGRPRVLPERALVLLLGDARLGHPAELGRREFHHFGGVLRRSARVHAEDPVVTVARPERIGGVGEFELLADLLQ